MKISVPGLIFAQYKSTNIIIIIIIIIITSWNSTLKRFENEVIQDGCFCCFFFLILSSYGSCFYDLNPMIFNILL